MIGEIAIYDEPEQWPEIWSVLKDSITPSPTECDELITDTNEPLKYVASIIYKHYPYLTIDHTILDKSIVTRSFITTVLDYCFTKKEVIRSFVKSSNKKSIKFLTQLGFVREGAYRKYFSDGSDFVIFSLTKYEWAVNKHRRLD